MKISGTAIQYNFHMDSLTDCQNSHAVKILNLCASKLLKKERQKGPHQLIKTTVLNFNTALILAGTQPKY